MDESTIYKKLYHCFKPSILKIENESHLHKNHPQSPKSGNSHFSIVIKSVFLPILDEAVLASIPACPPPITITSNLSFIY